MDSSGAGWREKANDEAVRAVSALLEFSNLLQGYSIRGFELDNILVLVWL